MKIIYDDNKLRITAILCNLTQFLYENGFDYSDSNGIKHLLDDVYLYDKDDYYVAKMSLQLISKGYNENLIDFVNLLE